MGAIEEIFDGGHRRVTAQGGQHPGTGARGDLPPAGSERDDPTYDAGELSFAVPGGAQWAAWDDVNGVLSFLTDDDVMDNLQQNLGDFPEDDEGQPWPVPGTAEEAWDVTNAIWEGDPGGRGKQERVPEGATWLIVRNPETYTWVGDTEFDWQQGQVPAGVELSEPGY